MRLRRQPTRPSSQHGHYAKAKTATTPTRPLCQHGHHANTATMPTRRSCQHGHRANTAILPTRLSHQHGYDANTATTPTRQYGHYANTAILPTRLNHQKPTTLNYHINHPLLTINAQKSHLGWATREGRASKCPRNYARGSQPLKAIKLSTIN